MLCEVQRVKTSIDLSGTVVRVFVQNGITDGEIDGLPVTDKKCFKPDNIQVYRVRLTCEWHAGIIGPVDKVVVPATEQCGAKLLVAGVAFD